ncbi:MAG: hypothetical protein LBP23_04375 [Treponema sp.]|nr:hypothetical protein [Treponema sp.]
MTGLVKSCTVPEGGLMRAPVWVTAGTRAVTSVSGGTTAVMTVPLMMPSTGGEKALNTKAVISLAEPGAVVGGSSR